MLIPMKPRTCITNIHLIYEVTIHTLPYLKCTRLVSVRSSHLSFKIHSACFCAFKSPLFSHRRENRTDLIYVQYLVPYFVNIIMHCTHILGINGIYIEAAKCSVLRIQWLWSVSYSVNIWSKLVTDVEKNMCAYTQYLFNEIIDWKWNVLYPVCYKDSSLTQNSLPWQPHRIQRLQQK